MAMPKRVLISGAGIAGPALAFWLLKYGFQPTVVERSASPRDGGYAIDVRGAAIEVADRMGVLDELREAKTGMRGLSVVDAAGRSVADITMDRVANSSDDVEVMRGTLSRLIYQRTDGTEYVFGDSISRIEQGSRAVNVSFEHGEEREFDLVVGADGLHSTVRELVFGPEARFQRYLGYHLSIFSTGNLSGLDGWTQFHNTPGRLAALYRTQNYTGGFLSFASPELRFDPRDTGEQLGLLERAFADSAWITPQLLDAARSADDFYFDSASQIRMPGWAHGRVVLLGDAAHCPSPMSGQGSSLALVGAFVLAAELRDAAGDHAVAFQRYQDRMRGLVRKNQKLALDGARVLVPKSMTGIRLRNSAFRLAQRAPGVWRFAGKARRAANAITLPAA